MEEILFLLFYIALMVLILASLWIVFTKAGEEGWKAIIPIYNLIVFLKIIDRPIWWIIFFFIPCANIIVMVITAMDLAENFGKTKGWGIGMLAILGIIGYPILAFSDAKYTHINRGGGY